ncbi:MAG: 50S ribosomal protein L4 [Firmicutes bacterium]|nr:50S ribosomal protein L4 [Bacillota bacterium]
MPSINVLNQKGKQVSVLELDGSVFGREYNESVIHQVIVAQQNNARQGTKCTLTRTEVRGGGRKPWRQKGTGRARQGSIRSPQWVGGGVVFAPKPRDFNQKINKKVKKLALCTALSAKLDAGNLIAVDKFKFGELKTREMVDILKALKIDKRVLIVTNGMDEEVKRVAANIPNARTIAAELINVYDLVANAKCLMTVEAINKIQEVYKTQEEAGE